MIEEEEEEDREVATSVDEADDETATRPQTNVLDADWQRKLEKYALGLEMTSTTMLAAFGVLEDVFTSAERRARMAKAKVGFFDPELLHSSAQQQAMMQRIEAARDEGQETLVGAVWLSHPPHFVTVIIHFDHNRILAVNISDSLPENNPHPELAEARKRVFERTGTMPTLVLGAKMENCLLGSERVTSSCGVCVINDFAQVRLGKELTPSVDIPPHAIPNLTALRLKAEELLQSPSSATARSSEREEGLAQAYAARSFTTEDVSAEDPQQSLSDRDKLYDELQAAAPPTSNDLLAFIDRAKQCVGPGLEVDFLEHSVRHALAPLERMAAQLQSKKPRGEETVMTSFTKELMEQLKSYVKLSGDEQLARRCKLRFAEGPEFGRYMLDSQWRAYDYGPALRSTLLADRAEEDVRERRPAKSQWAARTEIVLFRFSGSEDVKRLNALPLVSGESGSGKTWEMLQLQPAHTFSIVIKPGEVELQLTQRKKEIFPRDEASVKDWLLVRNERVLQHIVSSVETALKERLGGAFTSLKNHRFKRGLHVVVDEVGGCPDFLRGLIAAREAVGSGLCNRFESVTMIAGGTGADVNKPDVGSDVSAFKQLIVEPVTGDFFINIVKSVARPFIPVTAAVQVREKPPLLQLLGNRRLSRLAADVLVSLPEPCRMSLNALVTRPVLLGRDACTDLNLPEFLAVFSVLGYRSMNGLELVENPAMLPLIKRALFYVLFAGRPMTEGPARAAPNEQQRTWNVNFWTEVDGCHDLITTGVLTFAVTCTKLMGSTIISPNLLFKDEHHEYTMADDGHRGCFRVTVAQAMMLQLCYGLTLSTIAWQGFEDVVAAFAHGMATALQTPRAARPPHLANGVLARFLNETLLAKNLSSRFLVSATLSGAVVPRLTVPRRASVEQQNQIALADPEPFASSQAVTVERLPEKIGTFVKDQKGTQKGSGQPSTTVTSYAVTQKLCPVDKKMDRPIVFVSAPQSPFADVMLIFPGHSAFLLQAKCLKESLTEKEVVDELFKMGFEPALSQAEEKQASTIKRRFAKKGQLVGVYIASGNARVYVTESSAAYAHTDWDRSQGGVFGYKVLRHLMQQYRCRFAFPVLVTKKRVLEPTMQKLATCRCPTLEGAPQDVPTLWWDATDLYPLIQLEATPTESATEGSGKKRTRAD